jgi:energy-coupling factor transporter ATP-binding protein EcfA2
MKKNEFDGLYQAVRDEKVDGNDKYRVGVAYTRNGNFSVFIRMVNPVEQYCADIDLYYHTADIYTSLLKTLGDGYALQKQDVYCRQLFSPVIREDDKFLNKAYMSYFKGREYTELTTYLIITQELKRSTFMMFDKKKWGEFWTKIQKIQDILIAEKVPFKILNAGEITEHLHRYLAVSFRRGAFSFENFTHRNGHIECGERLIKMVDMVDIDEVQLPMRIKPYRQEKGLPLDLFSFMGTVPEAECVVYTQTILIPNQRKENAKLSSNMNRKRNIPDPANLLAAQDIENVMNDIAKESRLLVYTNFTVMLVVRGKEENMVKAYNYLEKQFYDLGIAINKNAYNQLELFINTFPGNEYMMRDYEQFLCLHDAAVCFLAKEHIKQDEKTPLKIYYTDRQGVPVAIDISGKEGDIKYTTNSNFFSLGPSGSGKSFHMNSVVRQLHEQDTDIVMVDTGNSYEGLCEYFNGTYIAYTKEKPITMNPFAMRDQRENNIEKQNFLKSLVLLIWKGSDGTVTKIEDGLIDDCIKKYYDFYFNKFEGFTPEERQEMRQLYLMQEDGRFNITHEDRKYLDRVRNKEEALLQLAQRGEGGEQGNAATALVRMYKDEDISAEELHDDKLFIQKKVDRAITQYEWKLKNIKVDTLNFNSFYEFSIRYIPLLCNQKGLKFNLEEYEFLMSKFYKGGAFETTLNDNMEGSLFDQSFIVFEIDAIKDDPTLFPIVTLIIMDVFLQKMRLKKNRKALIIEEAWKAIASPMMAGYIKYLYKTVRKFWGIVGVVTQELNDIISNETVKEAIVNNSEITILLDQSKFKERYEDIAKMLGLSQVEQRKIWTINQLDNKEGRSYFKEVYIRRGNHGDVFGVEESPESYMAYTTERVEKDALKVYVKRYGDYEKGITRFVADWKKCCGEKSKADKYAMIVDRAVKKYAARYDEEEGARRMFRDWEDYERNNREKTFIYQIATKEEL